MTNLNANINKNRDTILSQPNVSNNVVESPLPLGWEIRLFFF